MAISTWAELDEDTWAEHPNVTWAGLLVDDGSGVPFSVLVTIGVTAGVQNLGLRSRAQVLQATVPTQVLSGDTERIQRNP